jgi:DNA-binding CsgD family transcriptional regulator
VRARDDITRAVQRRQTVPEFARTVTSALARAVPFDGSCLLATDPATLLPTREVVDNGLPADATARLTEIELREPDFNKFTALARRGCPAASLSAATGGELDRSVRQRELRRPSGFDDELRVALSDDTGTWGALTLLRGARTPRFSAADVTFVASMSRSLSAGLRRSTLLDTDVAALDDRDTGLVVLAPDGAVETSNPAAERWLDDLGSGGAAGSLPVVVSAVAARTRTSIDDADPTARRLGGAHARVRTRSGRWVVVRGSRLGDEHGDAHAAPVAILLEPATTPEMAPLIADAYGLTPRERRVTELVARGFTTDEIASRLHLSAYTVQDHLKALFEKTGVGSRGRLVAQLFFDHYAPRLTSESHEDDTRRADADRPTDAD